MRPCVRLVEGLRHYKAAQRGERASGVVRARTHGVAVGSRVRRRVCVACREAGACSVRGLRCVGLAVTLGAYSGIYVGRYQYDMCVRVCSRVRIIYINFLVLKKYEKYMSKMRSSSLNW